MLASNTKTKAWPCVLLPEGNRVSMLKPLPRMSMRPKSQ